MMNKKVRLMVSFFKFHHYLELTRVYHMKDEKAVKEARLINGIFCYLRWVRIFSLKQIAASSYRGIGRFLYIEWPE